MAVKIDADACISCGACEPGCPMGIIEIPDVATLSDPDSCTDCGACVSTCPVGAIELA